MAETTDKPSRGSAAWETFKSTLGQEVARGVSDIGSTFQACLYNNWHTQSASIDSPELIAEQLNKDEQNKKLEPEPEAPKVGLEKE